MVGIGKIITIVSFIIFLNLFLISASKPDQGCFKVGDEVEITQKCTINGSMCDSCNISSIKYPKNSTKAVINVQMIKGQSDFNYSFNKGTQMGVYIIEGDCYYGGDVRKPFIFEIEATNNGMCKLSTGESLISLGYLVLMLGLTVLFGYLGFKYSENKYLWVLGIFFLFFGLLLIVYDVWLGYEFHLNYSGIDNSSMPEIIFWIFMSILTIGFLVTGILMFRYWKKVKTWFMDGLKNNDEVDGDENW